MPVGFNSVARNLFLLGSSGADLVTNFFKRIDRSSGTEGVYIPDEIRYNIPDQKFILAGTRTDSNSKEQGWLEKRSQGGSSDWEVIVQSTTSSTNTTLKALQIDGNDNLIVCGKTGTVPWIAKYDNDGNISWQVTSNTNGVEYTGIAVDSSNNLYVCGSSATEAFIEKVDGTGTYSWGKYSSNTAGAITFVKCAANDRGEVVAVGKIEDTVKDKGYIAKVDTATGDLLWDRTIEDPRLGQSNSYLQTECTDVYIDGNDQIYIIGTVFDNVAGNSRGFIIKYTAEGNIIWQKETPIENSIQYVNVKSDTETEQTVVFGFYTDNSNNDIGILSKYSKDGSLVWRRRLYTSIDNFLSKVNLDADPSFYYLLFIDEQEDVLNGTPVSYVYGKVSTSGNGLGNFEYSDSIGTIFYETLAISDNIGRLSDGSVRVDTSDLITYPFGANKILFDDLATQVANKKVQVDEAGTYSDPTYSITTAIPKLTKPSYILNSLIEDNLIVHLDASNNSSYSGTGTVWADLSGNNNNGSLLNNPTFNLENGGSFIFDGSDDQVSIPDSISLQNTFSTNSFSITSASKATNLVYPRSSFPFWTQNYALNPTWAISNQGMSSGDGSNNSSFTIEVNNGGTYFSGSVNHQVTLGSIYIRTFVFDRTNGFTFKYYVNGVFMGEAGNENITGSIYTSGGFLFGNMYGWTFSGSLYNIIINAKALSPSEVLQNFYFLRGKYSI
jgi:hypothetical protein